MARPGHRIGILLAGAIGLSAASAGAQPSGPPPDAPPPPPPPGPYSQPPPPYGPPPPYAPQPPSPGFQRQGWFIGFSLGAGSLTMRDDSIESDSFSGPQFGLRFGGMVAPQLGLMVEFTGATYGVDEASQTTMVQTSFGIAGQYWPISQLWLRAGISAGGLGQRRDGNKVGDDLDGMVLSGAIGYEVWRGRHFTLDLSLNAATGRFDPDFADIGTTQGGASVGFNWY